MPVLEAQIIGRGAISPDLTWLARPVQGPSGSARCSSLSLWVHCSHTNVLPQSLVTFLTYRPYGVPQTR